MLSLRSTEVKRMTEDLESLQGKINDEKNRHSAIIEKMNLAAKWVPCVYDEKLKKKNWYVLMKCYDYSPIVSSDNRVYLQSKSTIE